MTIPTASQKAWRRFRRNRPAFAGLCFVVLSVVIAVFAYCLAPDHSPDANTQLPTLALQPPGTKAYVLVVHTGQATENVSWWARLAGGQPSADRLIPVDASSVRVQGDSLIFMPTGVKKQPEKWSLLSLLYPVTDSLYLRNGVYHFKDMGGNWLAVPADGLAQQWSAETRIKTRIFPLGTDKYGRCMWSRLLLGFRISLMVGLIAVVISLTIGVLLGLLGGYFGGRLDEWVMLLVNTIWSIPTLLLVFAIVLALGRGIGNIFFAVGLTMWVDVARMVRGQTMALRALPFVEAAQSMGLGHWRILSRHILPNLLGPVLVLAAGNFATAILVESGLSYLGFGVQPPTPSWGSMLHENYGYAIGGKPLMALAPALVIALMVLAFNLVGNGLRDALDVKGR
jgi:peptide/nickel transport system permease protein